MPRNMSRRLSAKTRASHSAWKGGSPAARSIGPKPCLPPTSFKRLMPGASTPVRRDAFTRCAGPVSQRDEDRTVDRPWYASFNWLLALACVVVTVGGIVFIGSATLHTPSEAGEVRNQSIYAVLGIGLMFGFAFVDYHLWQRWAAPIYVLNVGLLIFILLMGHSALGAQRWISIGSFTFQPSEPAKLSLAIAIAALLCRSGYQKLQEMLLPLLVVAVPALLILKQPDLGTTLVIGAILTAELFFGLSNLLDFGIYAGGIIAASEFVLTS